MSPAPSLSSSSPPPPRDPRRRGLVAVASLAGVGAAVSAFMLAPTGATTAASAPVVVHEEAIEPVAPVVPAARTSVAPRRVVSRPASTSRTATVRPRIVPARSVAHRTSRGVPARARTSSMTTAAPTMTMDSTDACVGLNSAVDAFMAHFYAAHLETSPGQQVLDALSLDQYATTHLVLVENMVRPLVGGGSAALDVFLQHVYAAHLETSPGQQVADALAVDQYALTHTVMIADMVRPLAGTDVSSC
jgi:hypothetical protein